jgi:hypothetical protein
MENDSPQNGSIDLDALDGYLHVRPCPRRLLWVVGPRWLSDRRGRGAGIDPAERVIPVIWGDQEPEFATEAEMRTVLGTIMGRYNEIAACFTGDREEFDPIFWEGPEGEAIASDWGRWLPRPRLRYVPRRGSR